MMPEYAMLIGTIIGGILGVGGTIITTLIQKKSEENKQKKELIYRAAIDNWKEKMELLKLSGGGKIDPLDSFIIYTTQIMDVLLEKNVSREEIEKAKKRADELSEIFAQDICPR